MLTGTAVGIEPTSLILPPTESLVIPFELHPPHVMSAQN